MNKEVIVENLEQLIEEHKKEKIPYKTYEFDSTSYTLLLIDINKLKNQLKDLQHQLKQSKNFIKMIKNETYQSSVEGICDTALERLGGIDE